MIIEHIIIAGLLFVLLIALTKFIKKTQQYNLQEDRANRYLFAIDSLDKWCRYDLPEIEVICKYLIAKGEGLPMNAGTPIGNEACTISGLREQIRRMKNGR